MNGKTFARNLQIFCAEYWIIRGYDASWMLAKTIIVYAHFKESIIKYIENVTMNLLQMTAWKTFKNCDSL